MDKELWQLSVREALETIRVKPQPQGVKANLYSIGKAILSEGMTVYEIPAKEIPGWDRLLISHREEVESAIAEGRQVPAAVLEDYPDLLAEATERDYQEHHKLHAEARDGSVQSISTGA